MSDSNNIIPISDEQAEAVQESAKAAQEAIKALRGFGGFLEKTFGTVPADIVGLLGGDWLKVRRAENLAETIRKAKKRLQARGVETPEPASLSLTLPILVAAADESRDELQDLWARLLAAAADPARASFFRLRFIETAKKMDPLDVAVLSRLGVNWEAPITPGIVHDLAQKLGVSRDQVDVSCDNLRRQEFLFRNAAHDSFVMPFAREFLRAVSD